MQFVCLCGVNDVSMDCSRSVNCASLTVTETFTVRSTVSSVRDLLLLDHWHWKDPGFSVDGKHGVFSV